MLLAFSHIIIVMATEILPNLWLGGLDSNISNVDFSINATMNRCNIVHNSLRIPLKNRSAFINPLRTILPSIANKIHAHYINNDKILIYCKRGHRRSATIMAYYLMKYHNMTNIEAISYIKNKRKTAFPPQTYLIRALIMNEWIPY